MALANAGFAQDTTYTMYYNVKYEPVNKVADAYFISRITLPIKPNGDSYPASVEVVTTTGRIINKYKCSDFLNRKFVDTVYLSKHREGDTKMQIYDKHSVLLEEYRYDKLGRLTYSLHPHINYYYAQTDTLVRAKEFLNNKGNRDSTHYYYPNGKLMSLITYSIDGKSKETRQFNESGEMIYHSTKSEGAEEKILFGNNKLTIDFYEEDDALEFAEAMPEYPGGSKALFSYLSGETNYPRLARDYELSGTVYIAFHVDTDGSISNAYIMRPLNPILEFEALRVIESMPPWKPGLQNDQPVKVLYKIPLKFTLE